MRRENDKMCEERRLAFVNSTEIWGNSSKLFSSSSPFSVCSVHLNRVSRWSSRPDRGARGGLVDGVRSARGAILPWPPLRSRQSSPRTETALVSVWISEWQVLPLPTPRRTSSSVAAKPSWCAECAIARTPSTRVLDATPSTAIWRATRRTTRGAWSPSTGTTWETR